jgi:hypothetical protein
MRRAQGLKMLVGVPLQVLVTGERLGVGVGVRRFRQEQQAAGCLG